MKSELALERLAHGETDYDAETRSEPDISSRLEEIRKSDAEILARFPPRDFVSGIERRKTFRRFAKARVVFSAMAATALFALLLGRFAAPSPDTRVKGSDLRIIAYVKSAQGASPLAEGSTLGRGDEIQFSIVSASGEYGALLSIDGRGSVTTIMPLSGEDSVSIGEKSPETLHYSYRLDDAPTFEDFYLVVREERFPLDIARSALKDMLARGAAEPVFPEGYRFTRFHVVKKEAAK